jgi:hypothetical protein
MAFFLGKMVQVRVASAVRYFHLFVLVAMHRTVPSNAEVAKGSFAVVAVDLHGRSR